MNNYPTTAEIDANLPELPLVDRDFILVRKGNGMITWEGSGRFAQYESSIGFGSETAAISNAQAELSDLVEEDDDNSRPIQASEIEEGVHFEVGKVETLYHWESMGPFEEDGVCSEAGFEEKADCVREAQETLALVSLLGVEVALERIDRRALLISRLYPSHQQLIADAIAVLPFDRQWQAGYEMASTMLPMPSQHWPDTAQ
ncbi:MAG: hypothetical protein WA947_06645 [Phormidesmis sp.]